MFSTHQKTISQFARKNPDNMAKVLSFVIVTIRNRLFNCPADMETLEFAPNQEELAAVLYGFKADAIAQIDREKDSLFWQGEEIFFHAESDREAAKGLLNLFTSIHGFGLAKAGFACQLIYGVSACLDSHNLERFGINPNSIRSSTFKNIRRISTREKWIDRYCDFVATCGGTESLWDSWCTYVFNRPDDTGLKMNGNVKAYKSAEHVSAIHCHALGLEG